MRVFGALAVIAATTVACNSGVFRQYEYEEDMYLSLDGRATVYVNSSVAALDALRGAAFDASPSAPVDRSAVARFYATPVTRVKRVATSRRSGRAFVHVRLDVDDVQRLAEAAPFAWSSYRFARDDKAYQYEQVVGPSARKEVRNTGWTGRELVAFRLHLPSKIESQNARDRRRGNILVWEQSLDERFHGVPLMMDTRMGRESILYTTLWLFGATFVGVAITFGMLIWWVTRRGAPTGASRARGGVEA